MGADATAVLPASFAVSSDAPAHDDIDLDVASSRSLPDDAEAVSIGTRCPSHVMLENRGRSGLASLEAVLELGAICEDA